MDEKSRDLLVRTVIGEAGNQGPAGQAAVAHSILNRVASGRYGKTAADVVLAPHQYEPWDTRKQELLSIDPKSAAYQNVGDIVDMSESGDIPDLTNGSTHFLNPDIVRQRRGGTLPSWASQPIATVNSHVFYAPEGKVIPSAAPTASADPLDAINKAMAEP